VDPAVYSRKVEFSIIESPAWAERVLQVLNRCWVTLSKTNQDHIIILLENIPCIPTSTGMMLPNEAYFLDADIFHNLPVISLPSGAPIRNNLERLLGDLGVRKHVDLQVIFNRQVPQLLTANPTQLITAG
jgi:hypothetical protein